MNLKLTCAKSASFDDDDDGCGLPLGDDTEEDGEGIDWGYSYRRGGAS